MEESMPLGRCESYEKPSNCHWLSYLAAPEQQTAHTLFVMFFVHYLLLLCLMATGTCVFVDKGQFFQLAEKKDFEDASKVFVLNEDFFKCHQNEKHCPVVSKEKAGTAQTWRKISRK